MIESFVSQYSPSLVTAELVSASAAMRLAATAAGQRAAHAAAARDAVFGTGFRGEVADGASISMSAARAELERRAGQLAAAGGLLEAAAGAQGALDEAAVFAAAQLHQRAVLWLNAMSRMLDLQLTRALLGLQGVEQNYDPLFHHDTEDIAALHARYAATVPAQTLAQVEAVGGTILEAGPASTTVMVGDTVAPERVITMVAGATTGNPEQLAGELDKARSIAQATGASVIVWQGYAPPKSVPLAVSPLNAQAGADDLSMFQAALEERWPTAQKTVVAHSYGTLLATTAAHEHGLLADDLWLLGSPGVAGVQASDLVLAGPESTVHVVDAAADPVQWLRHGPSAAVGASPSYPGWGGQRVDGVGGGHSDHFTDPAFISALNDRADPVKES